MKDLLNKLTKYQMQKLVFASNLNGGSETGIIDLKSKTIFCLCTEEVAKEILFNFKQAKSYGELEDKISKFYAEDENEGGDLVDIGEAAASHFGFL